MYIVWTLNGSEWMKVNLDGSNWMNSQTGLNLWTILGLKERDKTIEHKSIVMDSTYIQPCIIYTHSNLMHKYFNTILILI